MVLAGITIAAVQKGDHCQYISRGILPHTFAEYCENNRNKKGQDSDDKDLGNNLLVKFMHFFFVVFQQLFRIHENQFKKIRRIQRFHLD